MRKSRKQDCRIASEKKKGTPLREKISNAVDMPIESLYNLSQIQMIENKEVIVEGCKEILEYDDNVIRITTKKMEISFWGTNLALKCFNTDNIIITGKLERVEFTV